MAYKVQVSCIANALAFDSSCKTSLVDALPKSVTYDTPTFLSTVSSITPASLTASNVVGSNTGANNST